jgi:type III secretory pathway component EscU
MFLVALSGNMCSTYNYVVTSVVHYNFATDQVVQQIRMKKPAFTLGFS